MASDVSRLSGDSSASHKAVVPKVLGGQHGESPAVAVAPVGSGRPAGAGPAMRGGAGAVPRGTAASGASPAGPRGSGRAAGTLVRPGAARARPLGGDGGSPVGRGAASSLRSGRAEAGGGAGAAGPCSLAGQAPEPPRVVTPMGRRAELLPGESPSCGNTATAPSAPSPAESAGMNFAHREQSKKSPKH